MEQLQHSNRDSMTPETFGDITLYNADCMDVMREMPDKASTWLSLTRRTSTALINLDITARRFPQKG
jgi:hypothetical protein